MTFAPLPVTDLWLERFRLRCERQALPAWLGPHQQRRKGQSLEFHDFQEYLPGDDFRRIDWRVSARRGALAELGLPHLVVRNFVAEESLRLVISIDTRPTLRGPEQLPKLQVAVWLAEALTRIVLRGDDEVVLHNLFAAGFDPVRFKGAVAPSAVRSALARFWAEQVGAVGHNLALMDRHLPAAAVWVIVSDFYLEEDRARVLARRAAEAREGYRAVLTVDLDSWPMERGMVREGDFYVEGPGVSLVDDPRYELDAEQLRRVERKIAGCKNAFFGRVNLDEQARSHWLWDDVPAGDGGAFFRRQFESDAVLAGIFARRP